MVNKQQPTETTYHTVKHDMIVIVCEYIYLYLEGVMYVLELQKFRKPAIKAFFGDVVRCQLKFYSIQAIQALFPIQVCVYLLLV
jgi:hypothetical protein